MDIIFIKVNTIFALFVDVNLRQKLSNKKVRNEWKHILKIIDLLFMKYVSRMMNVIKSVLCIDFVIHRKVRINGKTNIHPGMA